MDNPLEAQKNFYGADGGPPMLYTAEPSAIFVDQPSWTPPRCTKHAKKDTNKEAQDLSEKATSLQHLYAEIRTRRNDLVLEKTELDPCQLPGDFPPELAYRALAAYSLLRTLSIPLRLSPFTPNVFLRALYLPFPNKLLGDVHVALLRVLLPNLQMGYFYKDRGGGVGVHKRRHVDNIKWPLRAGDNLTHLDGFTWPLFYDDYCHLTADRLWESLHGTEDDTTPDSRYIQFRNIGLTDSDFGNSEEPSPFGPSSRRTRKTAARNYADVFCDEEGATNDTKLPATGPTRVKPTKKRGRPPKNRPKVETEETTPIEVAFAGDSDEEEYHDNTIEADMDSDGDDDWGRPRRKRRRRNRNKKLDINASPSGMAATPRTDYSSQTPEVKDTTSATDLKSARSSLTDSRIASTDYAASRGSIQTASSPVNNGDDPIDLRRIRGGGTGEERNAHKSTRPKRGLPMHNQSRVSQPPPQHQGMSIQQMNGIHAPSMAGVTLFPLQHHQRQQLGQHSIMFQLMQQQHEKLLWFDQMGSIETGPANRILPTHQSSGEQMLPSQLECAAFQDTTNMSTPGNAFLVSDDIAKALQDFMSGVTTGAPAPEMKGTTEEPESNDDFDINEIVHENSFKTKLEESNWVHFKPLERMRAGVPYHRLPLGQKLDVLEFIMDELLSIKAFCAMFSDRRENNDSIEFPYGSLPTEEELENLENEDECGVCRQEGDLLCCDGCVNSYHRECLAMNPGQDLAEGKWLCPECELIDPCKFGPLRGGRKCSLDWFSIGDLLIPSDGSTPETVQRDNTAIDLTNSGDSLQFNAFTELAAPYLSDETKSNDGQLLSTQQCQNSPSDTQRSSSWSDKEFLVIHGFVLCRERRKEEQPNVSLRLHSERATLTLTKAEVEAVLAVTDATGSQPWPLTQIPRSKPPLFRCAASASQYFSKPDSIDPCRYISKYRRAPASNLSKTGGLHHVERLQQMNYEKQCNRAITHTVSEILIKDMSLDRKIIPYLKTSPVLFDPYRLCIGYMLELEHTLKRSCLINPLWDGGKYKSRSDIWVASVTSTKSIRRLAELLLNLVDQIHPRVFADAWFHNAQTKTLDSDASLPDRGFHSLSEDWSIEKEKLVHRWQTTPSNMILSLCSKDSRDLSVFASQLRSDTFNGRPMNIVKTKRKTKKSSSTIDAASTGYVQGDGSAGNGWTQESNHPVEPAEMPSNKMSVSHSKCGLRNDAKKLIPQATLQTGCEAQCLRGEMTTDCVQSNQNRILFQDLVEPPGGRASEIVLTEEYSVKVESSCIQWGESLQRDDLTRFSLSGPTIEETGVKAEENGVNAGCSKSDLCDVINAVVHGSDTKEIWAVHSDSPRTRADEPMYATSEKYSERKEEDPVDKSYSKTEDGQERGFIAKENTTIDNNKETPAIGLVQTHTMEVEDIFDSRRNYENDAGDVHYESTLNDDKIHGEKSEEFSRTEAQFGENGLLRGESEDDGEPWDDEARIFSAKKKKKRQGKKTPGTSRRRNARRSGRLVAVIAGTENSASDDCSESAEVIPRVEKLDGMALQIENAKKQKIDGLEKLVKGQYLGEGIWPVAGRRIFPTVGNLPRSEMKRLARNGGTVIAADMVYHTNHEVAQCCYGHIWRKRMVSCSEFEEFLFLIRILESSLDRQTIHFCQSASKRAKSGYNKVVCCSIRNPSSGILDHFVVNKKNKKGCWMSTRHVDLSSLILNIYNRRQAQIQLRTERLREKQNADKNREAMESLTRMEENKRRRAAEAEAKRKTEAKKEDENRMRREVQAKAERTAKLTKMQEESTRRQQEEARRKAILATRQDEYDQRRTQQATLQHMNVQRRPSRSLGHMPDSAVQNPVAKLNNDLEILLSRHGERMYKLLRFLIDQKITEVPESQVTAIRKLTLASLKKVDFELRQHNAPIITEQEMLALMFEREKVAAANANPSKHKSHRPSNMMGSSQQGTTPFQFTGIPVRPNMAVTPLKTTSAQGNNINETIILHYADPEAQVNPTRMNANQLKSNRAYMQRPSEYAVSDRMRNIDTNLEPKPIHEMNSSTSNQMAPNTSLRIPSNTPQATDGMYRQFLQYQGHVGHQQYTQTQQQQQQQQQQHVGVFQNMNGIPYNHPHPIHPSMGDPPALQIEHVNYSTLQQMNTPQRANGPVDHQQTTQFETRRISPQDAVTKYIRQNRAGGMDFAQNSGPELGQHQHTFMQQHPKHSELQQTMQSLHDSASHQFNLPTQTRHEHQPQREFQGGRFQHTHQHLQQQQQQVQQHQESLQHQALVYRQYQEQLQQLQQKQQYKPREYDQQHGHF